MSLLVLLLGNWCVTLLVDASILLVVEDNNFYKFSSVSVLVKCVLVTQMVNFLKSTIENKNKKTKKFNLKSGLTKYATSLMMISTKLLACSINYWLDYS